MIEFFAPAIIWVSFGVLALLAAGVFGEDK